EAVLHSSAAKYLVIYECEVIKPDNWERSYHEQFDRIFTWNDNYVDGGRYLKINFATDMRPAFDFAALKARFAERKLACVIAGAKASNHPNELYSERVRATRWFEANAPQDFDLYGVGWPAADFPSYRGRVDDKLATLAGYRFSICFENAKQIPGDITEKILDCLRTGTVPVYGGAPNIEAWIPADCFVDLRQFHSYPEIYQHLSSMDAATHGAYLDRIAAFMASERARPFSSEQFVETVADALLRDALARRGKAVAPPQPAEAVQLAPLPTESAAPALNQLDPAEIRRDSFRRAGLPDASGARELIVYFGYGDELPVFSRARALWQFFLSHYPNVRAVFARTSRNLARGEVREIDGDLVVGLGANEHQAGYAATGVWSINENQSVIFRQLEVYRYLLKKYPQPFYLFQTTVTSVVDFRAISSLLALMPSTACYAGSTSRLNSPPAVANLTFNSGANCLFSRDVLELMLQRYDPAQAAAHFPNDVWQAVVLQDLPRTPLPFFSFIKPRTPDSRARLVPEITRRLLAMGHFHFRIKTTSAEAGIGLREEVDPWIMVSVMDAILASPPAYAANQRMVRAFVDALAPDNGHTLQGFSSKPLYSGPRNFPVQDTEADIVFPDLAD
ncbi:MAG TPA: glycosyltransferase family 10, partial [Burkholderiaceae bacterium]